MQITEVADRIEFKSAPPACQGTTHARGAGGHDRGPASYLISLGCPYCDKRTTVALCAGRVAKVRADALRNEQMRCATCHLQSPIDLLWLRIRPLEARCETP